MKGKGLGLVLLVAAGAAAWTYYNSFKDFVRTLVVRLSRVTFDNSRTKGALWLKMFFDVVLNVANPTEFEGTVKAVKLSVTYNDRLLATIDKTENIVIRPRSDTSLTFNVGVNTFSIFSNLADAYTAIQSGKPIVLKVSGVVVTNMGTATIKEDARLF